MRLKFLVPALIFAVVAVVFAVGLTLDPRKLPSTLINKPAPEFELPPIPGRTDDPKPGLKTADLLGEVSLVNVFASWCAACLIEHPILMRVSEEKLVRLYGINYKDKPEDAIPWLARMGDPFSRIGADIDGRVSIDWGVYGVPETFVVDAEGRVRYKQVGPITAEVLEDTIMPIVKKLRK